MDEHEELIRLREDCVGLEKQVKLLIRTEQELRRTRTELEKSRDEIEQYNRVLEQRVEERTRELAASRAELQIILDSMPVGVAVIGKDRLIRSVNRSALDLMNRASPGEVTGTLCTGYFSRSDGEPCFLTEETPGHGRTEHVLNTSDGKKIPVMKNAVFINLGGEEVLLEAFVDITMLKEAEEEKRKYQRQVLQADKMAAVGRLAGGIAHEINNPMGVILGFAQSVAKRIPEGDPLSMPLRSIEREAVRCKALVENLLTYARTGRMETDCIDINALIAETLLLVEAQTRVKNVEIVKNFGEDLPCVPVNANQIQQVVVNLCTNALDAMPRGGRITLGTSHADGFVEISVGDTGTGMDRAVLDHLFEPFFTTKEPGRGTGLGLSICWEIMRRHNGSIDCRSEPGKGTVFLLRLPDGEVSR